MISRYDRRSIGEVYATYSRDFENLHDDKALFWCLHFRDFKLIQKVPAQWNQFRLENSLIFVQYHLSYWSPHAVTVVHDMTHPLSIGFSWGTIVWNWIKRLVLRSDSFAPEFSRAIVNINNVFVFKEVIWLILPSLKLIYFLNLVQKLMLVYFLQYLPS
jgi:hypothetical protein